jgi:8-oxo-dGTP pyrophosphatase MutT (NUDIX family)
MSKEELIDIYDENRNFTGIVLPRKTKLTKGQYMLYVLAAVCNKDGKILITKRSLDKKWAAGSWEIPGGGADSGETSVEAVCREVLEETGIKISPENSKVIYSYRNDDAKSGDNYFADIYLCKVDFKLTDVTIQEDEVIDVRLATMDEIKELKEKDGFLHYERLCQALASIKE